MLLIFGTPISNSLIFFVGEGGEEMEGGVVGAATADDGRKAVTCRV